MSHLIRKTSGDLERFDKNKLAHSLRKAGAAEHVIEKILSDVSKKRYRSTEDIHKHTLRSCLRHDLKVALHYNIKQALKELGPTGYPFEKFIAALLHAEGYSAVTNQFIRGQCVQHEVDVVAEKQGYRGMVECKYRSFYGSKIDVKIALYVYARFLDIKTRWEQEDTSKHYEGWIATNTKFTSDAIAYSECHNMKLIGWAYPKGNIAKLIETHGLIPITVIPHLHRRQKEVLMKKGIIVCRDLLAHPKELRRLHIPKKDRIHLLNTIRALCDATHHDNQNYAQPKKQSQENT